MCFVECSSAVNAMSAQCLMFVRIALCNVPLSFIGARLLSSTGILHSSRHLPTTAESDQWWPAG
jgi:hypothetical protein